MPIPQMTIEEKRNEETYRLRLALSRIPKNKRWIAKIIVNFFLVSQKIENMLQAILSKDGNA